MPLPQHLRQPHQPLRRDDQTPRREDDPEVANAEQLHLLDHYHRILLGPSQSGGDFARRTLDDSHITDVIALFNTLPQSIGPPKHSRIYVVGLHLQTSPNSLPHIIVSTGFSSAFTKLVVKPNLLPLEVQWSSFIRTHQKPMLSISLHSYAFDYIKTVEDSFAPYQGKPLIVLFEGPLKIYRAWVALMQMKGPRRPLLVPSPRNCILPLLRQEPASSATPASPSPQSPASTGNGASESSPASLINTKNAYWCTNSACEASHEKMLQCQACLLATYCGQTCQKSDWKDIHKFECRRFQAHNATGELP